MRFDSFIFFRLSGAKRALNRQRKNTCTEGTVFQKRGSVLCVDVLCGMQREIEMACSLSFPLPFLFLSLSFPDCVPFFFLLTLLWFISRFRFICFRPRASSEVSSPNNRFLGPMSPVPCSRLSPRMSASSLAHSLRIFHAISLRAFS